MQYPSRTGPIVNDAAAFSPEMVVGVLPVANRQAPPHRFAGATVPPDVLAFGIEMVIGWHPDTNRAYLPLRLGWQTTQTTPVAAPFGPEMAQGVHPDQSRAWKGLIRQGQQVLAPDVPVFSIEMVQGWHPDTHRMRLGPRIPLPVSQPTHTQAAFSPDMILGSKPDRGVTYVRKPGWQVSLLDTIATTTPFFRRMIQRAVGGRSDEDL
jgi:hypothetical protein